MSEPDFKAASKDVAKQGYVPDVLRNYHLVESDGDGPKKYPITLPQIIENVRRIFGEQPFVLDEMAFVDDGSPEVTCFDREISSRLFGYWASKAKVDWKRGDAFVPKSEFVPELLRQSKRFNGIEEYPHEPLIPDVYYREFAYRLGDGRTLEALLAHYNTDTDLDRELLKAAILTTFAGIEPGARPLFVFDGVRGAGKTKTVESIAYIRNTSPLMFGTNVTIEYMEKRMLSKDGRRKQIVLLDNVKSRSWSWASLESLITTREISGHQMYKGEGDRLNYVTYFATFNAAALGKDLAQRSVIIRLNKGDYSESWQTKVRSFIDSHRPALVGDIIAALRAERVPAKSLLRWDEWDLNVLSRLPASDALRSLILDRQGDTDTDSETGSLFEERISKALLNFDPPYDPAKDRVHIPSKTMAGYFKDATGMSLTVPQASGTIKQLIDEGELKRIQVNPRRDNGRGFLWVGINADPNEPVKYDFGSRTVHLREFE